MKQTIYHCIKADERYAPTKYELVHQAETERDAIIYLEENGGGIYRNVLHNFSYYVQPGRANR